MHGNLNAKHDASPIKPSNRYDGSQAKSTIREKSATLGVNLG
jgi:hypothetical protein